MKNRFSHYAVCAALMAFLFGDLQAKPDVAISYDPTQPSRELGPVWLSYCIGRLSYVLDHPKEYPKKPGKRWIPTIEEETEGRFVGLDTYRALRKAGKIGADSYWEDVSAVSDAGFLKEYVWAFFRRESWPAEKAPPKLEAFEEWRSREIPNHKPYTNGEIIVRKR